MATIITPDYMDYTYSDTPIIDAPTRLKLKNLEQRKLTFSHAEYLAHKHRIYELYIRTPIIGFSGVRANAN